MDWVKLNVDAALNSVNRKMGFGFVLRDENASFIAAKEVPWEGFFSPSEAEAIAVREALKWIKVLHLDQVQVETDCLKVVQSIGIFILAFLLI